eukprot:1372145-Amorphochlora_amoeboformis.AAC.1
MQRERERTIENGKEEDKRKMRRDRSGLISKRIDKGRRERERERERGGNIGKDSVNHTEMYMGGGE